MYPKLTVNWQKLQENIIHLRNQCQSAGVHPMLVTKLVGGWPELIQPMDGLGLAYFADSRIQNLKKISSLKTPKLLLRIPMISELPQVLDYTQASLQSEWDTIWKLEKLAKERGRSHDILLMMDLGDLREGYFQEEELRETVAKVKKLDYVNLIGIGTNLSCYGSIRPTTRNLSRLSALGKSLRRDFNLDLPIISGGSTNALYLLQRGDLPEGINSLRIGEGFFLGTEPSFGEDLPGMHQDVFNLSCEIIEIKEKPSVPIGERGYAAFRTTPVYEDRGIRRRGILAIGKQDTEMGALQPKDSRCTILGGSSDHLIVDLTDSERSYRVGDILDFTPGYSAILRGFTSDYVHKECLE